MVARWMVLAVLVGSLGGCLNWQGSYDETARRQCRERINYEDRRACLERVDENSWQKRAERRTGSDKDPDNTEVISSEE